MKEHQTLPGAIWYVGLLAVAAMWASAFWGCG